MGKDTTRIDFYNKYVTFTCHICHEVTRVELPEGGKFYITGEAGKTVPNGRGVKVIREYAANHLCIQGKPVMDRPKGTN